MIFCQADWLCVRSLVSSRLCRETQLGLIFFSSLSLFSFLFSSSSSSSSYKHYPTSLWFSFSILHHITNRRRQLMNWRRRRYIVFEFLYMMAGRGQHEREREEKIWIEKKREKRKKTNLFSVCFFNENSN